MTELVLIDYGCGNIRSASRALARASEETDSQINIRVTADPETIRKADRLVLPGVGHFADCKTTLASADGAIEAIKEAAIRRAVPFFGICVGAQLLATRGLEDGETTGLDFIQGIVDRISPGDATLAIPHMGWNEIHCEPHPVLNGLGPSPHVYFTHSYVFQCEDADTCLARFDYGGAFTAAVGKDNIFGSQFHPEKSQRTGIQILKNFLNWSP